jgi:hypothetical protein
LRDEQTVVHHVEACSFPNWTGTNQVRRVTLSGDDLVVTADQILWEGKLQITRLVFQRAAPERAAHTS